MLTLMSPIRQNVATGEGQVSSFQESAGCILSVYDQLFNNNNNNNNNNGIYRALIHRCSKRFTM